MSVQTLCVVVDERPDHIRFVVDDVTPSQTPLDTVDATQMWRERIGDAPLAWQGASRLLAGSGHGLLQAVHLAYASHTPLVLDPDTLWITLAQGVARHISTHAESLRSAVGVTFDGRKTLEVGVLDTPTTSEEWIFAIQGFGDQLQSRHPKVVELMMPNFSTSTSLAHTVGQITTMYGFRRYYDYLMTCICGIPTVELRGTVLDWDLFRSRLDGLDAVSPEPWLSNVKHIANQLQQSRHGEPDAEFWGRIYKERAIYGGSEFTGWIGQLFPYLGDEGTQENTGTWRTVGALPSGVVGAEVLHDRRAYPLLAGVVGAQQDDRGIRPALGWAVGAPTGISGALSALSEFRTDEPVPEHLRFQYLDGSAALSELTDRAPGLGLTGTDGSLRFVAAALQKTRLIVERTNRDDTIECGEQGMMAATFPGGVLFEMSSYTERGPHFPIFSATDDGEIRPAAPTWLALLLEIKNSGRVLGFLDNEASKEWCLGKDDWRPPCDMPVWDGCPGHWRFHRWTTQSDTRIRVVFEAITAKQAGTLRNLEPALRALAPRQALDQLRAKNSWVLNVNPTDRLSIETRLSKAGLEHSAMWDTLEHTAMVNRATGERVRWPKAVYAHMLQSGVEQVNHAPGIANV